MADSNLMKIFKEALRDNKYPSRDSQSTEKNVEGSYSDSSCSKNNNFDAECEAFTENCDIICICPFCKNHKEPQSETEERNAYYSVLCGFPDSKPGVSDVNMKVPEWNKVFKDILGNYSSEAVIEQNETQKTFKNLNYQRNKKDAVRSHYYNTTVYNKSWYSEKEFNMNLDNQNAKREPIKSQYVYGRRVSKSEFKQTQEISEKKREVSRSFSYRSRSNYSPEQTKETPQEKREFIQSSTCRNKNWSNNTSEMIEGEKKARDLFAKAAILKPFTLKESLNDLAGCGVDVFKIGKFYNSPFFEERKTDSNTGRCCTHFEADVPLTGVVAKMKRLTSKDIQEEPVVPFDEAWDDDLLF